MGGMVVEVPSGLQMLSMDFQKPAVFQGPVGTISGSSVVISTEELNVSAPSYVQVLDGDALGTVVSVSSFSNGVLQLETPIVDLAEGDSIAVRPHITLSDFSTTPELSTNSSITFYGSSGTFETFTFFSGDFLGLPEGVWADSNFEDAGNAVIFPGEGFVLNNSGSPVTALVSGVVSTSPVKISVGPSFTLVGALNPLGSSTIGQVFSNLTEGAIVDIYGAGLTSSDSYFALDAATLGLGQGVVFTDSQFEELFDHVLVPASTPAVVTPGGVQRVVSIPASYIPSN